MIRGLTVNQAAGAGDLGTTRGIIEARKPERFRNVWIKKLSLDAQGIDQVSCIADPNRQTQDFGSTKTH